LVQFAGFTGFGLGLKTGFVLPRLLTVYSDWAHP